jgi:hypothetical protein
MVTWHGASPRSRSSASSARPSTSSSPGMAGEENSDSSEEEALRDTEDIAAEAEGELAPGAAADSEHQRAERLRRDQLMVDAVLEEGIGGPRHRYLEEELIVYAARVLRNLLADGRLVSKATKLLRPPVPADAWADFAEDDRAEFVQDMIATGLPQFNKVVFEDRRWSPGRGASLKTYFVNACILNFARLQAQWLDDKKAVRPVGLELDPSSFPSAPDPASAVIVQDEVSRLLRRIPDQQVQRVLVLRAAGYTAGDAAREAGLTIKAAEGRLGRIRKEILRDEQAAREPHEGKRPDAAQGGR